MKKLFLIILIFLYLSILIIDAQSQDTTVMVKSISAVYEVNASNPMFIYINEYFVKNICNVNVTEDPYFNRIFKNNIETGKYMLVFDNYMKFYVNIFSNVSATDRNTTVLYSFELFNVSVIWIEIAYREPDDPFTDNLDIIDYNITVLCKSDNLLFNYSYIIVKGSFPYSVVNGSLVFRGSNVFYADRTSGLGSVRVVPLFSSYYYYDKYVSGGQIFYAIFDESVPGPGYSCCNVTFQPGETLRLTTIDNEFGSRIEFGETISKVFDVEFVIETSPAFPGSVMLYFIMDNTSYKYGFDDFARGPHNVESPGAILHSEGFIVEARRSDFFSGPFMAGIIGPEFFSDYAMHGSGGYGYYGFAENLTSIGLAWSAVRLTTPFDFYSVHMRLVDVNYSVETLVVGEGLPLWVVVFGVLALGGIVGVLFLRRRKKR